ncbi:MAG TPA: DUF5947 family protein [Baekduia sp.]|nr:DUF5947 family protein [Baekduia sp.]
MTGALLRLARWAAAPAPAPAPDGGCELCPTGLADDHRHLLHLADRRIVCVCEQCWSVHSGDPEYRPAGARVVWLEDLELPDGLWAALGIPAGLAFVLRSSAVDGMVALEPSPAGVAERPLDAAAWQRLCAGHRILASLEPDAEALVADRLGRRPRHAIAPIDRCYRLAGAVRAGWEGVTGGPAVAEAVDAFFADLRRPARGAQRGRA